MKRESVILLTGWLRMLPAVALFFMLNPATGQKYLPGPFYSELNHYKNYNRFEEAERFIDRYIDSAGYSPVGPEYLEALIHVADLYRLQGYTTECLVKLDSIQSSIMHHGFQNSPLYAFFLTTRGTVQISSGDLKNGRVSIMKAIRLFSGLYGPEDTLLAPCFNKMGNYYYFNKIYDSALFFYEKALVINEKKLFNLEEKASYLQNIGIIKLELYDLNNAESHFIESLKIKQSILQPTNYSLGRIYLNIGRFYQGIFKLNESIDFYEKAEQIFSTKSERTILELGKIYWNKGLLYHMKGEPEIALNYLMNARSIIDSTFRGNEFMISTINSDIANIYKEISETEKAKEYYKKALVGADSILKIKAFRNLSSIYLSEGQLELAGSYLEEIISDINYKNENHSAETGLTCLYYGKYLNETGSESAMDYYQLAYDIFNKEKEYNRRDLATVQSLIGDLYSKKKQYDKGLQYYQSSLITIANQFTDSNFLHNPKLEDLEADIRIFLLLGQKAMGLMKYYQENGDLSYLKGAIQTGLLAIDLIDEIRLNVRTENSRMQLSNDINNVYSFIAEGCLLAYDKTGDENWIKLAFTTLERNKSNILLSELSDDNAADIGAVPETTRSLEKEIKSYIYLFTNKIWEEENADSPDVKKLEYYRSTLLTKQKKYDSLMQALQNQYPTYYKYRYDPSVITVNDLQDLLKHDEILIEYAITDQHLMIFLITQEDLIAKKVPCPRDLSKKIMAMKNNLDFDKVPEYTIRDYNLFQTTSYELYHLLIEPIRNNIGKDQKLIIIPDGELSYVSFEALIESIFPSDTINFRALPYLIKKHPITYASSATILGLTRKGKAPRLNRGVLAMAPTASLMTRTLLASNKALADALQFKENLPGAIKESQNILKIMKGRLLLGEEATESAFKKIASQYDILHFATHTDINNINPLSSMLTFNQFGEKQEDGFLQTFEIYNLDLDGELAVLSACSSGNGKLLKGEGVLSLARAFTSAGMPSVVMTLWDVDDISTSLIIQNFYHLLNQGTDKDKALQISKLNYIKLTRSEIQVHPAFWSGSVLYGNSRGFKTGTLNIYICSLCGLTVLLLFTAFIVARKFYRYRKFRNPTSIDLP
ncbi:MAG TPA: CHAT domain-containing protein [Bacteroidales bacterium]|nr:CHAT domain-containing protein [Bacteroidales bacterium]